MAGIARRKILLTAISSPLVLSGIWGDTDRKTLHNFDGTPVQRAKDPQNMDSLEREHYIEITAPETVSLEKPFDVTFTLPNHEMTRSHHISWLRVLYDTELVSFITLAPVWQRPKVTLSLVMTRPALLGAVVQCSRHKLWGNWIPLQIAPEDTESPPQP